MKNKFKILDLTLVYILGIIVLVNIISVFFFFRLDLTEGNIYSLSDASKKLVSELDDKVIVKCFFSKELPPQMNIIPAMIKDNLDEYKAYSNGNFNYEFIDQSDKEFAAQIMDYQLPSAQVQMLEKDEFKVKKIFMGMVIIYEDKKEIIPFVQEGDLPAIEYEITSKIRKLIQNKLPRVAILEGFGSTSIDDISTVYQLLSSQYVVDSVKPSDLDVNKVDALLIIGPKENFSQEALRSIDDYIIAGGKVGFFIDKTDVNLQMQNVKEINLNLDSLMTTYGVKVNNDLVGDKEAGVITVRQQKGFFAIANQLKYPFLPEITNLDRKSPVTQKIESVNLYFASSLDTTSAVGKDVSLEILARTSENAFVQSKSYNIIADRDIEDYKFNASFIPLIALLKGSFTSHFDQTKKGIDTRIAVSGDAEFFQNKKYNSNENINLFLNLVDWLTADETLISIRSKTITQRPLDKVSETGKIITKWINISLIPLLIAIMGFIKWRSNKKRKDFSLKK